MKPSNSLLSVGSGRVTFQLIADSRRPAGFEPRGYTHVAGSHETMTEGDRSEAPVHAT
jgi:hypothetical protein